MRLNSDTLYLSLMAQAFDTEIVPELRSEGAKAIADVLRHCFAALLRRQEALAFLVKANVEAGSLIEEGQLLAQHRGLEESPSSSADQSATDALDFAAQAVENEQLTGRLARLSRRLATTGTDNRLDDTVKRFLRRAAEWEYRLHAELTQPGPQSADGSVSSDLLAREPFEAFLRALRGDSLCVRDLTRVEGGYGKQTYFVTIGEAGVPDRKLVVRKANRAMTVRFGAFIVEKEFHLLSAVAATGFPAPRPLWLGTNVDGIDGDFFVMERLSGRIPGSLLGGAERISQRYLLDLAAALARLHSMELERFSDYIDRYEAPSLRSETIEQCYRRSIGEWRRHVAEVTQVHSPVMEYLFAWLADNVPKHVGKPVLVHGDFNIHNILASDDGRVSGVLDWECAMFGAPEQDLAYIRPHISKHIDWDRFIMHYRESGGRPPDEASLDFYQAFSAMRVLNGLQWFTKKLQNGESREVRLCMAELGFAAPFMRFALNQGGT